MKQFQRLAKSNKSHRKKLLFADQKVTKCKSIHYVLFFYALRVCASYNADNYYNLDNIDKDYNERIR